MSTKFDHLDLCLLSLQKLVAISKSPNGIYLSLGDSKLFCQSRERFHYHFEHSNVNLFGSFHSQTNVFDSEIRFLFFFYSTICEAYTFVFEKILCLTFIAKVKQYFQQQRMNAYFIVQSLSRVLFDFICLTKLYAMKNKSISSLDSIYYTYL